MFKVINKKTREEVYESSELGHAEIYRNTCHQPWEFVIIEIEDELPDNILEDLGWVLEHNAHPEYKYHRKDDVDDVIYIIYDREERVYTLEDLETDFGDYETIEELRQRLKEMGY